MVVSKFLATLVLVNGLFFGGWSSAKADAPGDCWQESGNTSIIDGFFHVEIDTRKLPKQRLLEELATFTRDVYLQPIYFPLVDDGNFIFTLHAMNQGPDETREEFQARINRSIQKLRVLPGVSITCELKLDHHPAVTGSN